MLLSSGACSRGARALRRLEGSSSRKLITPSHASQQRFSPIPARVCAHAHYLMDHLLSISIFLSSLSYLSQLYLILSYLILSCLILSIYLSIRPSIHPCLLLSIDIWICLIDLSIYLPIYPSIHPSIDPSPIFCAEMYTHTNYHDLFLVCSAGRLLLCLSSFRRLIPVLALTARRGETKEKEKREEVTGQGHELVTLGSRELFPLSCSRHLRLRLN